MTQPISYTTVNGVQLPNLLLPQDKTIRFGRYAEARREFLMNHHKPFYTSLKLQCQLDQHLKEVQDRAEQMEEQLMTTMAAQEGLTEKLKAENMMTWVQGMNNLKQRVQEIVMSEVIYQR
ncbi:MAG: TnpV protein [Eubacterium sp.]|nr:TnpV protein [Eubacterium sp.]